ncbi:unnamed protein product [Urochloa humidicola]
MRQLARLLARVADSASAASPPPPPPPQAKRRGVDYAVPEGHVPVHVVGEGPDPDGEAEAPERFLVRAELLGRPALAELPTGARCGSPAHPPPSAARSRASTARQVDRIGRNAG